MKEETAHIELMTAINSIKVTQELSNQKLEGIDQHLATLNSKVATQAGQIGEMQIRDARADGKREGSKTVIMVIWVIGSTLLSSIGVTIFNHIFK